MFFLQAGITLLRYCGKFQDMTRYLHSGLCLAIITFALRRADLPCPQIAMFESF